MHQTSLKKTVLEHLLSLDFFMPGQQQRLLLPVWVQDNMNISKEYAPLGAKTLI